MDSEYASFRRLSWFAYPELLAYKLHAYIELILNLGTTAYHVR